MGIEHTTILQLPSPEGLENVLSNAVNEQGTTTHHLVVTPQETAARARAFTEEIGLGAISKAGALPMGTEGEWLEFAEKKLRSDENLDYQALLWEMGSEIAERKSIEQGESLFLLLLNSLNNSFPFSFSFSRGLPVLSLGGFNLTYENQLLLSMESWFLKNGGKLRFVKPAVAKETGFQLLALEEINEFEPIIQAPLKMIMCKQSARNVVIKDRGKYLGDELQKTFEKNELWGMVIFLLHEYYKETAGNGSKWGPFIRTLRMRSLTTPVIQSLKGTIAHKMYNKWIKDSDAFMWWSVGADGPCSPTTGICKSKPNDRTGDSRFSIHQIRWAYWVVKQNAVKIKQISTG
jgi:hypothetical protein